MTETSDSARFASALRDAERRLTPPPERVLIDDASDASLAAALVAAKIVVPIDVGFDVRTNEGQNAHLIGLLAQPR